MLRLREATPEDIEAIVAATEAGWLHGYRDIVAPQRLAGLPVERWRHEVSVGLRRPRGDAFTLIAEMDGEFAGYCFVAAPSRQGELGPSQAELVALYVIPGRWGHGAGGALLEAAMDRVAALGYEGAFLWTFAENERAICFYEAHGWEPDGERKRHSEAGAVALRFRKGLQSAQ